MREIQDNIKRKMSIIGRLDINSMSGGSRKGLEIKAEKNEDEEEEQSSRSGDLHTPISSEDDSKDKGGLALSIFAS